MIKSIVKIHGSSSAITFECENEQIKASGEFFAKDGMIAGFSVSTASLKHENGEMLTEDERQQLIQRYEEYMKKPHELKKWGLRFE